MPGRDASGPVGAGPRTGRGFGFCQGYTVGPWGGRRGCGYGRGFGRGFGPRTAAKGAQSSSAINSLKEYQDYLEEELRKVRLELEDNK